MESRYPDPMIPDEIKGAANRRISPVMDAAFALMFHPDMLPSERLTRSPKMLRLQTHIQSEPPRLPVNSYHCMAHVVRAKEFPSTSHGHEISASK